MNRNFPSCIGEDAFEWVGDRNKTPHSLPDVTSSNTRYTCEDDPSRVLRYCLMISSTSMHRGAPCTTVHHDLCAPAPWCITVVVHRIAPCTTVRDRPCAPALRCIIATLHQGARCSTMCDCVTLLTAPPARANRDQAQAQGVAAHNRLGHDLLHLRRHG